MRGRSRPLVARVLASTLALILMGVACSDDSSPATDDASAMAPEGEGDVHDEDLSFGEPADPADADRVVQVTQLDEMAYDPAAIEIAVGETIAFEVTNAGQTPHEFVLGDADLQSEHEEEMAEMGGGMMTDEPNAIAVEPGETVSIAWTFTEPGELQYGCHIPGHFAAGMVGDISVS